MKKILFAALVGALVAVGCSKNENNDTPPPVVSDTTSLVITDTTSLAVTVNYGQGESWTSGFVTCYRTQGGISFTIAKSYSSTQSHDYALPFYPGVEFSATSEVNPGGFFIHNFTGAGTYSVNATIDDYRGFSEFTNSVAVFRKAGPSNTSVASAKVRAVRPMLADTNFIATSGSFNITSYDKGRGLISGTYSLQCSALALVGDGDIGLSPVQVTISGSFSNVRVVEPMLFTPHFTLDSGARVDAAEAKYNDEGGLSMGFIQQIDENSTASIIYWNIENYTGAKTYSITIDKSLINDTASIVATQAVYFPLAKQYPNPHYISLSGSIEVAKAVVDPFGYTALSGSVNANCMEELQYLSTGAEVYKDIAYSYENVVLPPMETPQVAGGTAKTKHKFGLIR